MITTPRPTRQVVHRPTRQVVRRHTVELEVLFSARNPHDYIRRNGKLRDGFEQLAMPDEVWQRAIEVQ